MLGNIITWMCGQLGVRSSAGAPLCVLAHNRFQSCCGGVREEAVNRSNAFQAPK